MKRVTLLLTIVLASTACPKAPESAVTPPPAPPPASTTSTSTTTAATTAFPPGPEVAIFESRCSICHTTQYIAQQRLTLAQWEKTVTKMKGWGAPISDDEVKSLSAYFALHYNPTTPPSPPTLVDPPPEARP
jgi:cytochrome c5